MSRAREDIGYDRAPRHDDGGPANPKKRIRGLSIPARIRMLMQATAPKWWSPHELSRALNVRSAARRLREIIREDKFDADGQERPKFDREFEEKWVDNVEIGEHKVYRWKGTEGHPTLF